MNKHRYLFLGDSVTDCERNRAVRQPNRPDALGNGWVNRVATQLLSDYSQAEVWNRGYAGCRTAELLNQSGWLPLRSQSRPVYREITVLIGINDIWHPIIANDSHDIDAAIEAYSTLLKTLRPMTERLTTIEPFAIDGPAVNERWWPLLDQLCEQQAQVSGALGAHWLATRGTLNEIIMVEPKNWLYDGVHPGLLGHQWLARRWLDAR